jgi:sugar phosphate isomerase/epimerase
MGATQQRVLDWALQQVKSHVVDRVVLGGDLTHHDNADHAHGFLNELGITQIPMDYLPGNNEGPDLQIDAEQFANVKMVVGCQEGGEGWPDRTFLLQTTTALDAAQSVRHMLEQWPDQGNVLILAHFPPDLIEGAVEALSDRPEGQQVWWICGHRHQTQAIDQGTLHVRICGGLDPVKIKGQTPCIYLIDWDGSTPVIGHQNVPETILSLPPAGSLQAPIGLAYRDTACGMIETALEHGIAAIQFHASVSKGEPTPHELSVVQRFREQFPDGFLSLHLPNFQVYPEPISLELMEPWLHWAQAIGVNDLTAHLPISAKSSDVFDEQQNWLDTAWVHTCQQTYLALAKRALAMNAMLSLENHYNKTVLSPGEVKLSSYPWHLTHFVCWLRDALSSQGYSQNQIEQIGIIFDVGHAFSDATVAKQHGIADWLNRIGPYFQLSHIHQIVASDQGSRTHHQAITHVLGPLLNYVGVLNAMGDVATKPIPLLIEVRDRQPALASWYTLNMA